MSAAPDDTADVDVLDVLDGATLARRTVKLILDGATQETYDAAVAALDDAVDQDTMAAEETAAAAVAAAAQKAQSAGFEDTPAQDDPVDEPEVEQFPATAAALDYIESLREKVIASEVTFHFEALDWTARIALQAAHPPRIGNLPDQMRGYNTDTYLAELVRRSCFGVVGIAGGDPKKVPEKTWAKLLGTPAIPATGDDAAVEAVPGTLNFAQISLLVDAAESVNDRGIAVPPSARSSFANQGFGASSTQPGPGTSPRAGSGAGSRRTARKSSATRKATPSRGRSSGT